MGGIGKTIGNVVGSITGANAAADAQVSAANAANDTSYKIYQEQVQRMSPFFDAGQTALAGLQGLVNDRQGTLNNFYNSGEYQGLANQARYQQLAAAEATGGLGSTATSNGLASIAPQLGQNYLNSQYNNLLGLTNVGLNAGGAQNAAAGNYATSYGQNMSQIGAAQAGQATAGFNTLAGLGSAWLAGGGTLSGLSGLTGLSGTGGGATPSALYNSYATKVI